MPTPRSIQRTYLILLLGNTLAASFIWGINTIFLLDAGLTNLEAFAANAFFTAGMVLFEVPTGIVADTIGRRTSYLLGTVTLTASTLLYVLLWQIEAPFWAWAVVSILLGLGFTFFSGAVEAWLIDALKATGFTGEVEAVFGRGQVVSGAAMLTGSVAGGIVAEQVSLGAPFVLRGVILAVMFGVAYRVMHDVGFSPEKTGGPLVEMRKIASDSIDYGWRVPAVKWLMVEALFTGGVGIYAFYALQPYLLELYGDPQALPSPHLGPDRDGDAEHAVARDDRPRRELLGSDRADRRLGASLRGDDADPTDVPERADPLPPAGDDPLLRLDDVLDRRRLGPARARSRRGRLGLRALVPRVGGDLRLRGSIPRAVAASERAGGHGRDDRSGAGAATGIASPRTARSSA